MDPGRSFGHQDNNTPNIQKALQKLPLGVGYEQHVWRHAGLVKNHSTIQHYRFDISVNAAMNFLS